MSHVIIAYLQPADTDDPAADEQPEPTMPFIFEFEDADTAISYCERLKKQYPDIDFEVVS